MEIIWADDVRTGKIDFMKGGLNFGEDAGWGEDEGCENITDSNQCDV